MARTRPRGASPSSCSTCPGSRRRAPRAWVRPCGTARLNKSMPTLPSLDALFGGSEGLARAACGTCSGGVLRGRGRASARSLATLVYVTVLSLAGDGPLGGMFGAVNALRALSELASKAAHPGRCWWTCPPACRPASSRPRWAGSRAPRVTLRWACRRRTPRQSADVGGTGARPSTVFAFPTSSPAEARRPRTLLSRRRADPWCTCWASRRGPTTRCGAPCVTSPAVGRLDVG